MNYDANLIKSTLTNIFTQNVMDIYEELYKKDRKLFEIYQEYILYISDHKGRRPSLADLKVKIGMSREMIRLKLNELVGLGYLVKNEHDASYDPTHSDADVHIDSAKKIGELIDLVDLKFKEGKITEEQRNKKIEKILNI